ncbi:YbjQ family protein [Larkinella humicola]|uniref:YbjQ family protein n=1 Tax=Larkinella humicola TaxID=2607654 RepID=A0A5N1JIQ2_9BACT|nr:YbjQ family protein [Larkinella humicola]KAA9355245.1 YbjQ family protein [Larkinella humicola]
MIKLGRYGLTGTIFLVVSLVGCFRPAIPISMSPNYPVDVFYENQQPDRPFTEMEWLEYKEEVPLTQQQQEPIKGRMVKRGNNIEQKELLLARLTMQAKKLGADALIAVRYQYYSSATVNGYSMRGMAVKYQKEREVRP